MFENCSVVELRQYTLHAGARQNLISLFESEFIRPQQAIGMLVFGPFCDLDDRNRFVWIRGFPDMVERKRMLARAIPEQWLLIFPHDHHVPTTRIALNDNGRPIATSD